MAARTVSTPAAEPARTPSLPATGVIAEVTTQSMPQQTYVECRLACLGTAGDEDVETRGDRGLEEAGGLAGQRAQRHQLVEAVRLQHELADVDRHVPAGDVRNDDVQAGSVGHHRVDERLAHVDPPSRRTQHPLDQVGQLTGAEDGRGQLAAAAPGDEHPARLVDPELTRDARLRVVTDGNET